MNGKRTIASIALAAALAVGGVACDDEDAGPVEPGAGEEAPLDDEPANGETFPPEPEEGDEGVPPDEPDDGGDGGG